jgi:AcrR family transcriptional regulator
MAAAVGEQGYAETTVGDVLRRAGMSRRTFYQLFSNREDCYLAAYETALAGAMERLAPGHTAESRRWERVEAALAAFLEYLAAEPGLARLWLVEPPSVGPSGLELHERTMRQLAERLAELGAPPGRGAMDGQAAVRLEASVGAVHRVVQARLLDGRAHELPGLASDLAGVVRELATENHAR